MKIYYFTQRNHPELSVATHQERNRGTWAYLNSERVLHHEREHFVVGQELLECEALALDHLTHEHREVAMQRDVERGLVRVILKDKS